MNCIFQLKGKCNIKSCQVIPQSLLIGMGNCRKHSGIYLTLKKGHQLYILEHTLEIMEVMNME